MSFRRGGHHRSLTSRAMATAIALVAAALGSGLPQCVGMMAQPASHHSAHTGDSPPQASVDALASGNVGQGCANGAACLTTGTAAALQSGATLISQGPGRCAHQLVIVAHPSFVAPPPSPPPQA